MGYLLGSIHELLRSHFFDVQLSNVLMGVGTSVEVPIITMVGRQIGYSESSIASYVTLIAVCRVIVDIPTGLLVECVDVRRLMFLSVLAQIMGCTLVVAMKPGPLSLALFSVVSGSSIGIFFLTRHIYVAQISKQGHRGIVMSFLSGMLRWSHVLGPLLLGLVASAWDDGRYFFTVPLASAVAAAVSLCVGSDGSRTGLERGSAPYEACGDNMHQCPGADDDCIVASPPPPSLVATDVAARGETTVLLTPSTSYEGTALAISDRKKSAGGRKCHTTDLNVSSALDCSCMARSSEEIFGVAPLWHTIVEHWSIIWRLGIYIILYVALRANRKLLLTFAAMRLGFTDSQVAFLLSLGFAFDACLFPIGGIVMDVYGRRYAMVPVVLGLGVVFVLLPLLQTSVWMYTMAALFGIADALGCGLVMTLIADHAPHRFGGLFFGVMRMVQDMGHVVGATVVSLALRHVDFDVFCAMWGGVGVVTALWACFCVPVDTY